MEADWDIPLGKISNLPIQAAPSAFLGSAVLWLTFGFACVYFWGRTGDEALFLSLAGVLLHWIADVWHQLGHAGAAYRAGAPMECIRLCGILGRSVYPVVEPVLPKGTGMWRAVAGPWNSLLLAACCSILLAITWSIAGTLLWWIVLFFALDNLVVYCLGALLPLGDTDGGTLLRLARAAPVAYHSVPGGRLLQRH